MRLSVVPTTTNVPYGNRGDIALVKRLFHSRSYGWVVRHEEVVHKRRGREALGAVPSHVVQRGESTVRYDQEIQVAIAHDNIVSALNDGSQDREG